MRCLCKQNSCCRKHFVLLSVDEEQGGSLALQLHSFCSSRAELHVLRGKIKQKGLLLSLVWSQTTSGQININNNQRDRPSQAPLAGQRFNYSITVSLSCCLGNYPSLLYCEVLHKCSKCERKVRFSKRTGVKCGLSLLWRSSEASQIWVISLSLFVHVVLIELESFHQSGVVFIRALQATGGTQ